MGKNSFAVAMTYCGAVVGAGFATGREVALFFSGLGQWGLVGVALATTLFILVGVVILDITHRHQVYSYLDLLKTVMPWRGTVFITDLVFLASLWIGVGVMTAAGGRALQGWGVAYPLGCFLFLLLCLAILARGAGGFVKANCWLAPALAVAILLLCGGQICRPVFADLTGGPVRSSLLYVSFNAAIAGVALSTLKDKLSRREVLLGGVGGGLLLGAMLALVLLGIAGFENTELPLLTLAAVRWGRWQWLYTFALLAAVLTTALANIHGLACRLAEKNKQRGQRLLIAGGGYLISQFGFGALVAFSYPLLGLCNIVLLAGLCYYSLVRAVVFLKRSR